MVWNVIVINPECLVVLKFFLIVVRIPGRIIPRFLVPLLVGGVPAGGLRLSIFMEVLPVLDFFFSRSL